jgi:hypothetical protein
MDKVLEPNNPEFPSQFTKQLLILAPEVYKVTMLLA